MLFIEVLFKGCKFVFTLYAAFPPRFEKSETVAHKLYKGCTNAKETYLYAFVLNGAIQQNQKRIEQDGNDGRYTKEYANGFRC